MISIYFQQCNTSRIPYLEYVGQISKIEDIMEFDGCW